MVVDVNVVVVKEKFSRACRAFIIVGTCFPNFRASTVRTLNRFDFFTHVYFQILIDMVWLFGVVERLVLTDVLKIPRLRLLSFRRKA